MSRREPPPPDRLTGPISPVEIIECYPTPRVQLVIVLRVAPGTDPSAATLRTAQLISTVHAAERRPRLTFVPEKSRVADGEVTIVLTPSEWGSLARERLARVVGVVREAAAAFEGATLVRAEVVPLP